MNSSSQQKNSSEFTRDISLALDLAISLSELNETLVLNHLQYTKQVLKNIKEMPKLKPAIQPLRLSELAPAVKPPAEEAESKPSLFERLKGKLGKIIKRTPEEEEE